MGLSLLSPVAKIPFGKYKGVVVWQAPVSWFRWAAEVADETTVDILADALEMKQHEGQYAVLRKSRSVKFLYRLKSIHTMMVFAEAQCKSDDQWSDYVYSIIKPINNGK